MSDILDSMSRKILAGQFSADDFPVVPAKVVKVYLSSAGSDTLAERNMLLSEAYPCLREFCKNRYQLEFQVIDLGWGHPPDEVRHDADLHVFRGKEIHRCLEEGVGPSLVIFISQKYGQSPLPDSIVSDEFEAMRVSLQQNRGRDTRNAGLLDDWFVRDDNNLPPVYVRKHVTEMIPDVCSEDKKTRILAETTWAETESALRYLLEKGAELSYLNGTIDSDTRHRFSMSEQERDVDIGLADCDSPSLRCVVINRNIVDLNNYMDDPRATRFTEVTYNEKSEQLEVDERSATRLPKLTQRLRALLANNALSYDVLWRYDDVISPTLHRTYLERLRDDFCSSICRLVDADASVRRLDMADSVGEVYKHWVRCKQMASHFCAQDELLRQAQNYLQERHDAPLIIHGPIGSGKTTLLSKVALMTHMLWGDAALTVVRYVGLTPDSSHLQLFLKSVCHQVYTCWDGQQSSALAPDGQNALGCFHQLVKSFPADRLLVIYVDDVDDLASESYAQQLAWLPPRLPENVKIILTINSRSVDILERRQQIPEVSPTLNIDLTSLTPDQCEELFLQILFKSGRTISDEQLDKYRKTFPSCPLPMFMKLLSYEARHLKSFSSIADVQLPSDSWSAIHQLFDKLEVLHGQVLVSHAMRLHLASGGGLSDCEMEDVLSLDEDLLDDVYASYHPEMRRIPPSAWLRLKEDLADFLVTHDIDGVTVVTWASRMFQTVAHERYHCFEETVKEAHSILADYFLGTWANKEKPVKSSSDQSENTKLPCGNKADRKVPSQPLTFENQNGLVFYNKRKYDHVPRHLVLSGRLTEMNEVVLFNYDWLYTKIKALSMQHILDDFKLNPGKEAMLVEKALRAAESILKVNIDNLAPELTGHLLPYYSTHSHVRELLRQCDKTGLQHCALIPNFPYQKIPGGPLQHTLEPPELPDCFVLSSVSKSLLTKQVDSSFIYTYDLDTGKITSTVFASSGELHMTPDGVYFVIADHETEKAIKVHHSQSGEYIGQIIIENHLHLKPGDKSKNGPMCLTNERLIATMSTDVGYLCIADIATCQMLQIIELGGRISVCAISQNKQYLICNSDSFLMSYDLESMQSLATLRVGVKPDAIALTKDGFRCFLSNKKEGKLYNIHVDNGHFDLIYKVNMEEELLSDPIEDIRLSPNDDLVLIRANNTLLVHDRAKENICAQLRRPADVPKEFRLPKCHYSPLVFTQAEFSQDGQMVIGTIFRTICVWNSWTGELVTSTDAPVGIITSLVVSTYHDTVITHTDKSSEIHIWNITGEVHKLNTLDKLSGPIKDIQVAGDSSMAFIRCDDSDEVGVIDMHRGVLLDLLTHEQKLFDMTSTPSGKFLLVSMSPHLSDTATKMWDIAERKIIREFGNVPGYCVSMNRKEDFIFVGQKDPLFQSPYYVTLFHFVADTFLQTQHDQGLMNVTLKPCFTIDDRFLVVLSVSQDLKSGDSRERPTICVFDIQRKIVLSYYTADNLGLGDRLVNIVAIKPCPTMGDAVAVIYSTIPPETVTDSDQWSEGVSPSDTNTKVPQEATDDSGPITNPPDTNTDSGQFSEGVPPPDINTDSGQFSEGVPPPDTNTTPDPDYSQRSETVSPSGTNTYYGVFILRLLHGNIERITKPFPCSDPKWVDSAVFSNDFSFCLDNESYVRDLNTGDCITRLPNPGTPPRLLALNNSMVVYFKETRLVVIRLADAVTIADCDIHGTPCHIALCADQRTTITGCQDGTVVSHVIINPSVDHVSAIIKSLKSRQLTGECEEDGRATARSWDKVDTVSCPEYSRPPSVIKERPRDVVLLIEIQSVPRPRSQLDSLVYVNPKSQVCSIM
ncbi:NACHT and WD repeat domain-containing protein 2-like [Gigantopelta aegis]|uniref:NACHT and WD repeat domain-containing protein 2-like n=1 Tax=Gigantopelta aegis TaxID=1735272 RepID=UPI001B88ACF3|nr:NACHT and WD repeat domain-containing protein 2-like [Gigantopelta aegis]